MYFGLYNVITVAGAISQATSCSAVNGFLMIMQAELQKLQHVVHCEMSNTLNADCQTLRFVMKLKFQ